MDRLNRDRAEEENAEMLSDSVEVKDYDSHEAHI